MNAGSTLIEVANMPIYEYRCCACDAQFERLRPMSRADASGPCPQCGSEETRRCLSLFAAHTKTETGTRSVAGDGGCASCVASSCAGCDKG